MGGSLTIIMKPNGKFLFSAQFLSDFLGTQRCRFTTLLNKLLSRNVHQLDGFNIFRVPVSQSFLHLTQFLTCLNAYNLISFNVNLLLHKKGWTNLF